MLEAGLLLTWFVSDLSDRTWLVGAIVPIQYGVALIAQPWIGQYLAGTKRRSPWYTAQALVRGGLWGALAVAILGLGRDQAAMLLSLFFAVILLDAILAGVGNIAFSDTLARAIPRNLRGRARGWRGASGGLVAGGAGVLLMRSVSAQSGLAVFAALFAGAGVLYALGGLTFAAIEEPADTSSSAARQPLVPLVREMWRDHAFRRFVLVQILLVPAVHALPFITLLGKRDFSLNMEVLGLLIVADGVAPLVGNLLWGRLADARSNQFVIRSAAMAASCTPAVALVLSQTDPHLSAGVLLATFAVMVFMARVAQVGIDLATKNYLLDLAPDPRQRPVLIGVNDTLIAVPTIALVSTGVLIDLLDFATVFAVIAAVAIWAVVLTRRLPSRDMRRRDTARAS